MTDEKLNKLLAEALAATEQPPELKVSAPKRSLKWVGALAACACLALCVGVFFSLRPSFVAEPESAPELFFDAVTTDTAASNQYMVETESVTEESATEDCSVCAYPTAVYGAVQRWRAENAPDADYEVMADTERYYSIRTCSVENEPLYLVIDKQTAEPVSGKQILERGDFSVTEEELNMFYVNKKQELVLVTADCEMILGSVE